MCSNITTKNIDSRTGLSNSHIIDHIPIDVAYFDILKYTDQSDFKVLIIDNNINTLRIQLYDDDNRLVPLIHDWSMTLTFHEVVNIKKSKIDYNAINQIAYNSINNPDLQEL